MLILTQGCHSGIGHRLPIHVVVNFVNFVVIASLLMISGNGFVSVAAYSSPFSCNFHICILETPGIQFSLTLGSKHSGNIYPSAFCPRMCLVA